MSFMWTLNIVFSYGIYSALKLLSRNEWYLFVLLPFGKSNLSYSTTTRKKFDFTLILLKQRYVYGLLHLQYISINWHSLVTPLKSNSLLPEELVIQIIALYGDFDYQSPLPLHPKTTSTTTTLFGIRIEKLEPPTNQLVRIVQFQSIQVQQTF